MEEINNFLSQLDDDYIFVDVFGGSGVVSINSKFNKIFFNEIDRNLLEIDKILFFKNGEDTISEISKIIFKNSLKIKDKSAYLNFRNDYNCSHMKSFYELLVLVLFSFNSQIRFNSKGDFNVPIGKSGLTEYRKNNLISFSEKAKKKEIKIFNEDFEKFVLNVISENKNKKLVFYFDPPYLISTATYNSGWNEKDEKRLINILNILNNANIKFLLSNFTQNGDKKNNLLINFLKNKNINCNFLETNYKGSNYQRKNMKTIEILASNFGG